MGIAVGRRTLLALVFGLGAIVVFALVASLLGVVWGLILLAAATSLAALIGAKAYLSIRNLVLSLRQRDTARDRRWRRARSVDRERFRGIRERLDELKGSVASTDRKVERLAAHLSEVRESNQRLTAALISMRAEGQRAAEGTPLVDMDDEIALITSSGLFDPEWYQQQVGTPVDDPVIHYMRWGAGLGLDPHPLFPSTRYMELFPEALLRWRTPLAHFLGGERHPAQGFIHPNIRVNAVGEPNETDLKWDYLARGLHRLPDTFVVYRIIGNDLPPRHREGQSLDNLRFILANEPDLPGAEKRWVVNRIVDSDVEKEIISTLEQAGVAYIHIPFLPEEYRRIGWRFQDFDLPGFTYRREFDDLSEDERLQALDHVYHDKNLYVMNNNGARNKALHEGRTLAKWVLPWDGNCFITASAWEALVSAVSERPYLRYFTVPMARIPDNEMLLKPEIGLEPSEEPQILFRADAGEEFNEDSRYGRRPKVELFYRLGIPGPWDQWRHHAWDRIPEQLSLETGQFGQAGWVARLSSGRAELESNIKVRGQKRVDAIRLCIDTLDHGLATESFDPNSLVFLDEVILEEQRLAWKAGDPDMTRVVAELENRVSSTLDGPLYTVVSKTTLPPSGDPHDYWHPSPYWWPNPESPDGLPYIKIDGQRVPGTILWEPGSEQYDRSALQSMIDETALTTWLGYFKGHRRLYERAGSLIRSWFLNPETRMNPHLRHSQVRRGHNNDEGTRFGIIETSDFYYLLDAVRLLERSETLTPSESAAFREWFAAFRAWLWESNQGKGERGSLNNHGTWYDVQLGAIDAYLDDVPGLLETLRRSHERVGQQFTPDGRQPEELLRTLTQHYCTYNLQGWLMVGMLAERVGQDLLNYRDPRGPSVGAAIQWLLDRSTSPWPYEQIEPFDSDRFKALACVAKAWLPHLYDHRQATEPSTLKQVFSVHDGIRPFWLLGSRAQRGAN